ncbi:MAG: hypothetical protein VX446_03715 [Bacteroidota bacterium]|nr:hypothetical protein [Bacteroidota bacterium]
MTWKRVFAPALWATICVGLALQSCETSPSSSEGSSELKVSQDAPDNVVAVPDLEVHPELDPLSITVDKVGLVNFMGDDSLAVVLDDLYTYFHLSNVGEWDAMFEHFPGHRTADTAMLTVQKEMMDKWFHNGLRNRAGGCHIRYASPWVGEGDQQVALLGLDLNYFLDFFENFEGNPEGMRLTLQDQYGKDAIEYFDFNQVEDGDTARIRQFEVNAESSMYVLSSKDSLHCMFLPPQISKSPQLAAEMMKQETMLELLRHKREHFDKR